jgi:hypothetical protein
MRELCSALTGLTYRVFLLRRWLVLLIRYRQSGVVSMAVVRWFDKVHFSDEGEGGGVRS